MDTDRKWVIVRIDGKIAGVSTDYRVLARISAQLAASTYSPQTGNGQKKALKHDAGSAGLYGELTATAVGLDEIWNLRRSIKWDDLMLFGTEFQKTVWRKLWELTHPEDSAGTEADTPRLISYSDFAELCQNRAGVRAVAHAIGLNPISVIIPCHLVIPKESVDKIKEIHKKAEATIFKGDDLCIDSILNDNAIDFGEYSMGRRLKRELIMLDLGTRP